MKYKKTFIIFVVLLLFASLVLTACGTDEDEREQAEVSKAEETEEIKDETQDTEEALRDLKPMFMADGRLYLDTGKESEQLRRCGVMSGEITSTVAPDEVPMEDDQSNFGTGYHYQSSLERNQLEVNIDGKWFIFETEDDVSDLLDIADLEVVLDIEEADDSWFAEHDDYDEFIIEESDFMTKVALTTNVPIENVKVVKIDFESTDDGVNFYPVEELYVLDEFVPEKPFVIGLVNYGSIPHFGISFEDHCGMIQNYSLDFSGEDGSPLLNEIS